MKKEEKKITSKQLLFSHKGFKMSKKIIGLPKIEHKKPNKNDDIYRLSLNLVNQVIII